MNQRPFGPADRTVSELGLGTWPLGGPVDLPREHIGRGKIDESEALDALLVARECGITLFDTADIYGLGRSENLLGRAFGSQWGECLVATKVGKVVGPNGDITADYSPAHVCQSVDNSLSRLRKDVIDLYLLHNAPPAIACSEEVVACLQRLVKEGKIRAWGVSARRVAEAVEMLDTGFCGAALEVVFNVLRQEAADTLFPLVRRHPINIIVRVPLEYGVLAGRFTEESRFPNDDHRHLNLEPRLKQELQRIRTLSFLQDAAEGGWAVASLRFCLSFPEVTCVIPGARTPKHVRENVLASQLGPLPAELIRRARELYLTDFGLRSDPSGVRDRNV